MKLIIDIPDDYKFIAGLKELIIGGRGNCRLIQYHVLNAIRDGVPYEEKPQGEMNINKLQHKCYTISRNKTTCDVCGAKLEKGGAE